MHKITKITARQILDSRGNPTIEATVYSGKSFASASVPSGASKGVHEAVELRDGGKDFSGLGVKKAIKVIEKKIFPLLKGIDVCKQRTIDLLMINADGTKNKSRFGANSILAVSLACARLAARIKKKELYVYLSSLSKTKYKLPKPYFNIINGGKHADNKLSFQEFMIVPQYSSVKKNIQAASEIYHLLGLVLHKRFGKGASNIGDEGGFAPVKLNKIIQALDVLVYCIKKSGYKVKIALDAAASEFFVKGKYLVDGRRMNSKSLLKFYFSLIKNYPIISIEDPFSQEDFASFAKLKALSKIQVVGDDLTVTNVNRIKKAIENDSCNCLLLKVNQIGTLTEALDAAKLAFYNQWKVMVSHRSGETNDSFIADLSVALGCGQIKAGAPARGERVVKYNRLMEIKGN
ncbi:phosphopyruvate hydratase [archaeon]|nr:phosphopyruvate hydratase [archaeon]